MFRSGPPQLTPGAGAPGDLLRIAGAHRLIFENTSITAWDPLLRLYLTDIGDEGIAALVESVRLRRLRVLDLRNGRISDEGARLLAASPDLRRLERLVLISCSPGIEDPGEGSRGIEDSNLKADLRGGRQGES